jgi:pimeloyl-ACP methyl ester carboxylesterase
MATLATTLRNVPNQRSARTRSLLYRVGRFILVILALLMSLIIALPILLLFVATSVPWLISLVLTVFYVLIAIGLFRFAHTLPMIGLAIIGMMTMSVFAVIASQLLASTPPITDAQGQPIPNSIASLERVTLGGTEQWITIRGQDINNPVLLFLAGGPGGSELVMTRRYLGELESHFVVVNWDQPGAGRSYNAVDISTLTPERYVSDAYELTQVLRERFHQEKIYVLGESWGSILGIWLVQAHPDLFHAFISTGQMVTTTENDVMGYEFALNYLTQAGRIEDAEALRRNGSPPFTGDDRAMRFLTFGNPLNEYMRANAHGEGVNQNLFFDSLLAQEYGLIDKVNWVRGLLDVFTNVYPQIADLDFRIQAAHLDLPVYFIVGRWDVNAMTSLTEEYFNLLEAPHKEMIWFENSGHTPLWEEPIHFVDVMVNTVLAQTLPPAPAE